MYLMDTTTGPEVIKLESILKHKIKHNGWLLVDMCPWAANHCALFWDVFREKEENYLLLLWVDENIFSKFHGGISKFQIEKKDIYHSLVLFKKILVL